MCCWSGCEGPGDAMPLHTSLPSLSPALRSLTLGPSPLRGEGGPGDQRCRTSANRLSYVPPLHEVERGPGGEASKGRPLRGRSAYGRVTVSLGSGGVLAGGMRLWVACSYA